MSVSGDRQEIEIEFELSANYKFTNELDQKNMLLEFSLKKPKELIETEDGNFKIPLTIYLKKPKRKMAWASHESQFTSKMQREYGDINLRGGINSATKHVDFNSDTEWSDLPHAKCSKETITSAVSHISHSNVPSIITIKPSCFRNFESTMDTTINYFSPTFDTEPEELGNVKEPVKFSYKIPLYCESNADVNILYSRSVSPYPYETVLEHINNILEMRLKPFQDTINETKQAVYEILANFNKNG